LTTHLRSPDGCITVNAGLITAILAEDPRNRLTSDWAVTVRTRDLRFEVFRDPRQTVAEQFVDYLRAEIVAASRARYFTIDTAEVVAAFARHRAPMGASL
jgi:hypothetical protein